MNILLYNPDNQVTKNYMPHLWMFVLQAVTPPGHRVFLIDGNAQPMTRADIFDFVKENDIQLAGIGAMTRMAARAYQMADAIRSAGAKVVMGGPHVTEVPDEPIGRADEPRHADAVALGEADDVWPKIVADAEAGQLQEVYKPVDETGREIKPSLVDYPHIPWEDLDLSQFDLMSKIPNWGRYLLRKVGNTWKGLYVVPIESGRGCPYGCDFCTVTGFFGDSIRFRSDQSVVDEMLRLKARARKEDSRVGVFFIDDNFALNKRRTKSLLREIIAQDAIIPWVAQISVNLLKDEELVDLIKESGGRWIFMGLESIDDENLKGVNKGLQQTHAIRGGPGSPRQARHLLHHLLHLRNGRRSSGSGPEDPGHHRQLASGLPVFGLLTPYPATPLYDRLLAQKRLTRPKHWLDFRPFRMAFTPNNISVKAAEAEVHEAWSRSYSPQTTALALKKIEGRPFHERTLMFFTRLAFRGIYFPQMKKRHWILLLWQNRSSFLRILSEGIRELRRTRA